MLILAPVVLLLITVLALLVLQWTKPGFGLAWLVASIVALISWLFVMYLRLQIPEVLVIAKWSPPALFNASPQFLLDRTSWPYLFSLATLIFAVLLSVTARAQYNTSPYSLIGSLAMIALGMMAVLAGNPLTLMSMWVAIDVVELIILLSSLNEVQIGQRAIVSFGSRMIGTMILAWIVISNQGVTGSFQTGFDLNQIPSQAGIYILLSVGLRMGVFPLHLPFTQEPRLRQSLGSVMRLVPMASSLVLLGRLSGNVVSPALTPYLLGLAVLAAFYCGIMWLVSKDELLGRPYWLIGWASLALICAINGMSNLSIAWGITAILPGGLLFLYSARDPQLRFLPVLGLIGITGLPFMPAASGWQGLVGEHFSFISLLVLITHSLFLVGYARHAWRPAEEMSKVERWTRIIYPAGLFVLIVGDFVLGVWGWPGSRTLGIWWAGLASVALMDLIIFLYYRYYSLPETSPLVKTLQMIFPVESFRKTSDFLMKILRLDWFYQLVSWGFNGFSLFIGGVNGILEGDGGVLWSIVILILLLSVIIQVRLP
jgi:hypothetical protein